VLGLVFHFLIATSAAAVYVGAAVRWRSLARRPSCGGRRSAWSSSGPCTMVWCHYLPRRRARVLWRRLANLVFAHIFCIGLPIAFVTNRSFVHVRPRSPHHVPSRSRSRVCSRRACTEAISARPSDSTGVSSGSRSTREWLDGTCSFGAVRDVPDVRSGGDTDGDGGRGRRDRLQHGPRGTGSRRVPGGPSPRSVSGERSWSRPACGSKPRWHGRAEVARSTSGTRLAQRGAGHGRRLGVGE